LPAKSLFNARLSYDNSDHGFRSRWVVNLFNKFYWVNIFGLFRRRAPAPAADNGQPAMHGRGR